MKRQTADTEKKHILDLSSMSREELEKRFIELSMERDKFEQKARWYEEQYKLSQARKFGRSSEQGFPGQMELDEFMLFNEAEALRDPINVEPKVEELITVSRKKQSGRKKDLSALPVKTEVFELTPEEQVCPICGSPLHQMSEEVRVEVEVIPAEVIAHRYVSYIYSCRACEKDPDRSATPIKAPGAPAALIPGSVASPSLIADILVKKYEDALPFYRQEKHYQRKKIPITRNNLCNWTIRVARDYFKPLYERMREILYHDGVIHCDETELEVLNEPDRPAHAKSYVWVRTSVESQKDHPMALYTYTETRSARDARNVLKGYSGYIICDGYAGYSALRKQGKSGEAPMNVTLVACMVHIRRKFADALKILKPSARERTGAQAAINQLAVLFDMDNQWKDLPPEERKIQRKLHLKPAMEAFFAWVSKEQLEVLPRCKYGEALNYAINQKETAMNVFLDGRLEIENNMAERAVKPFVIGRKNWLFANTPEGAEGSCLVYSLIESAKYNGLIPFEYLKYVLTEMSQEYPYPEDKLDRLLPWSKNLPEQCHAPA